MDKPINNYINDFIKGNVGIDMINSDAESIREISEYIKRHSNIRTQDKRDLFEYYEYAKNDDRKRPWTVLIYDISLNCFNACRPFPDGSESIWTMGKTIMLAEDMLDDRLFEDNGEFDSLFQGIV